MKQILLLIILFSLPLLNLIAQTDNEPLEGTVSYVTTQNVYVRFESTQTISEGDTLFLKENGKLLPVLQVKNLSSISCVCTPLTEKKFKVSDRIYARYKPSKQKEEKPVPEIRKTGVLASADSISAQDTTGTNETIKPVRVQKINGKIAVASYTGLSNTPSGNSQRMRYTFSLNAKNIGNSRFSGESYISFVHRDKQWSEIKANVFNGLKIYSLALKYEAGKNSTIWLGRKINPKISNMGAVDGIQFEFKTNSFTTGILAGSRPDYKDYGFNTSLLQYGMYLNHEHTYKKVNFQTTLAFIEQKNAGITDRRFAYIQHSNSLAKNLNFFGSAEFDLYRYVQEVRDNSPKLSNLYLSLRYRFKSKASFSLSYSTRQNIIYYETYKSYIDQLLAAETTQGYLLQANYRPFKKLSVGATGGYRFRKSDPRPSRNVYSYATYSQVPWINVSATLSATLMESSYMDGKIYSLGLSRDIIRGKLSSTFTYRYIDYTFLNSLSGQVQNTGEISLNWRIIKKLSCSAYYEGTFEKKSTYNRIYLQISKSF